MSFLLWRRLADILEILPHHSYDTLKETRNQKHTDRHTTNFDEFFLLWRRLADILEILSQRLQSRRQCNTDRI